MGVDEQEPGTPKAKKKLQKKEAPRKKKERWDTANPPARNMTL